MVAPLTTITSLTAKDAGAVAQCLDDDRGAALFIASNLLSYGYAHEQIHFWGQWEEPSHTLTALMMVTGSSGCVYGAPGVGIRPLLEIALLQNPTFVMGRADLVTQAVPLAGQRIDRIERHYFAELPGHRFHPSKQRTAAVVRRATRNDINALVDLYYHTDGFEQLTAPQLRRVLTHRITHFRTYLAQESQQAAAAASTSAETASAAMIGGVWTAPWARNRGYAQAVVGLLCAELLRERRRPYLFYLEGNAPAARVYTRLGFRVIGSWNVIHLK